MHARLPYFAGTGVSLLLFHYAADATVLSGQLVIDTSQLTWPKASSDVSQQGSACEAWLPDLMKVKAWRSSASKCQTDITVTTQLSVDR